MSDNEELHRRAVDQALARWKGSEPFPAWHVDAPEAPARPAVNDVDHEWADHLMQASAASWPRLAGRLRVAPPAVGSIVMAEVMFSLVGVTGVYALLALDVAAVLTGACGYAASALLRRERTRRDRQRVRQARARIDRAKEWSAAHRITRDQLPLSGTGAPVRTLAGQVVAAYARLRATRAWNEGWIGDEWEPAIDRLVWSLVSRLRATIDQRTALADASDWPSLRRAVADVRAELDMVDTEARSAYKRLARAAYLAQRIDRDLTTRTADPALIQRGRTLRADLSDNTQVFGFDIISRDRRNECIGDPEDRLTMADTALTLIEGSMPACHELHILLAQLDALRERRNLPINSDDEHEVSNVD